MGKHENTLADIFAEPTKGNINWKDVESLFRHFGGAITEGAGSRIRVHLNGVRAVFHRPHPEKEACKGAVESARFLTNAGITP
jgi:hypothetical protein